VLLRIPKVAFPVHIAILITACFLLAVVIVVVRSSLAVRSAAEATGGVAVTYIVRVRYAALALASAPVLTRTLPRTRRLILTGLAFPTAAFVRYATRTWARPTLAATLILTSALVLASLLAAARVWLATLLAAALLAAALVRFAALRLPATFICHSVFAFHDHSWVTPMVRRV
jgi:hypothetical protein